LDSLLGDVHGEIMDLETQIENLLQQTVLSQTEYIFSKRFSIPVVLLKIMLRVSDLTSEVDCILALATAARDYGFDCRPEMSDVPILNIDEGRHPLQELCTDNFIPNDTRMSPTETQMHIITGPNASGKSIYLKQLGILTYLAHVGSFIPAKSAQIGFCDRIL
ncbi:hypothetical protein SARC_14740, partial [Sphaeroforma arctica JP610]